MRSTENPWPTLSSQTSSALLVFAVNSRVAGESHTWSAAPWNATHGVMLVADAAYTMPTTGGGVPCFAYCHSYSRPLPLQTFWMTCRSGQKPMLSAPANVPFGDCTAAA